MDTEAVNRVMEDYFQVRPKNLAAQLRIGRQDATEEDGRITIRLKKNGHQAILEVEDTGCGMDEDFIRNRLFKPFDTTKGNAGIGIGMSESREFIRMLGGDIRVQSKSGKGSIITLYIPSDSPHV